MKAALERTYGQIQLHLDRPPEATAMALQEVYQVLDEADSGKITDAQAQTELERIAKAIGKPALTWIVSNMPVYDREREGFVRFDTYAKELAIPGR